LVVVRRKADSFAALRNGNAKEEWKCKVRMEMQSANGNAKCEWKCKGATEWRWGGQNDGGAFNHIGGSTPREAKGRVPCGSRPLLSESAKTWFGGRVTTDCYLRIVRSLRAKPALPELSLPFHSPARAFLCRLSAVGCPSALRVPLPGLFNGLCPLSPTWKISLPLKKQYSCSGKNQWGWRGIFLWKWQCLCGNSAGVVPVVRGPLRVACVAGFQRVLKRHWRTERRTSAAKEAAEKVRPAAFAERSGAKESA